MRMRGGIAPRPLKARSEHPCKSMLSKDLWRVVNRLQDTGYFAERTARRGWSPPEMGAQGLAQVLPSHLGSPWEVCRDRDVPPVQLIVLPAAGPLSACLPGLFGRRAGALSIRDLEEPPQGAVELADVHWFGKEPVRTDAQHRLRRVRIRRAAQDENGGELRLHRGLEPLQRSDPPYLRACRCRARRLRAGSAWRTSRPAWRRPRPRPPTPFARRPARTTWVTTGSSSSTRTRISSSDRGVNVGS